mmetsp:Transcript_25715/g.42788  ORF Transcript_25715/g.42788 Transcript_25715/m.42788 type:complete len:242 (+) Transcript_25715:249-974(+)
MLLEIAPSLGVSSAIPTRRNSPMAVLVSLRNSPSSTVPTEWTPFTSPTARPRAVPPTCTHPPLSSLWKVKPSPSLMVTSSLWWRPRTASQPNSTLALMEEIAVASSTLLAPFQSLLVIRLVHSRLSVILRAVSCATTSASRWTRTNTTAASQSRSISTLPPRLTVWDRQDPSQVTGSVFTLATFHTVTLPSASELSTSMCATNSQKETKTVAPWTILRILRVLSSSTGFQRTVKSVLTFGQ